MAPELRRRAGPPSLHVLTDAMRQARESGNWIIAWLIVLVGVAALLAAAAYFVVPTLIYPAL